jgi:hypothetical protein
MKFSLVFALLALAFALPQRAADFVGRGFSISLNATNTDALVTYSNAFGEGVCTIQSLERRKWVPVMNFWVTQNIGQVTVTLPRNDYTQLRLRCVATPPGHAFRALALSYGTLRTIAGRGGVPDGVNGWNPAFEGAPATEISFSNPRYALGHTNGHIYVVEKDGHAVIEIDRNGIARTFLGTHVPGTPLDDFPVVATNAPLNHPSGLWILNDTLYVLDSGNSLVRGVNLSGTNYESFVLFRDLVGMNTNASGLWLGLDNRQRLFGMYGVGGTVRRWEQNVVNTNFATGFGEVAHITVSPRGRIFVSDPIQHRVYRVFNNGGREPLAGTGAIRGNTRGEDARFVALAGPRSVAFLPIGGYFIGLDEGARVWYVDDDDNAAPFVYGRPGVQAGDGRWFLAGGRIPKISNVQSVTVAPWGDMLILDRQGRLRSIEFLRLRP